MTDATAQIGTVPKVRRQDRPEAVPLPPPALGLAPLLITDCATPVGGETLLSLLWTRLGPRD
ncbi:MAG: hypothetical protein ACU0BF_09435 [Paracoccaceae bacterium]